jgi:hypothetical protein
MTSLTGPWVYTLKSGSKITYLLASLDNKALDSLPNLGQAREKLLTLWCEDSKEIQANVICSQSVMGALRGYALRACKTMYPAL